MKTLNASTKQAQRFIAAYNRASGRTIYQIYRKPSTAKIVIYERLKNYAIRGENGHDIRIISHNCRCFTMAWTTDAGLRVETRCHSYLIK